MYVPFAILALFRQVIQLIRKMKNSRSSGIDGISSQVIKPVAKKIAPAIAILINSSLEEGVFPSSFKQAKITCIYKGKGERSDKNNYRPISNLPFLGKCIP